MEPTLLKWLLNSDPWVEYHTRIHLLLQPYEDREVQAARENMIAHPLVKSLVNELQQWPGIVLNSHKSAGQYFHKLSFLADIGLNIHDPGIRPVTEKVMEHASAEGPFQLPMNISPHHGGQGVDTFAWALCDAPILVYSLAKMGLDQDPRVLKAKNYLQSLGRENGFPCVVSKELGDFRGPGKKSDPCPYATLVMLKLLSLDPEDRKSGIAVSAVESILNLWKNSLTLKPYIFYMGTDFRKIKAPFIWYDILHVSFVLSCFEPALTDPRFQDMVAVLLGKKTTGGTYIPESVWQVWKDWEFGQKKTPSAWITCLAAIVESRAKQIS